MTYTNNLHIESIKEVKVFFKHLDDEWKLHLHLESIFADYVGTSEDIPSLNADKFDINNRLIEDLFSISESNSTYIYPIGFQKLNNFLKQYIA
jgi:hypothetical protein